VPRALAAPEPTDPPEPHQRAPYQPPVSSMLKAALRDTVTQCARLVRGVPTGLKAAAALLTPTRAEDGQRRLAWPVKLALAPRTALNVSITNQRAFATVTLELKEALLVGQAFGATLNDVVMAIVSGALRRYLDEHGDLPHKSLVAAVPVSLRADGNAELNNQVSMTRMSLCSDIADPQLRMRAIVKASAKMKKTLSSIKSIMPTDFPSLGVPWMMSALVAMVGRARLADALPSLANLVVSNLPGPRVPMYLAGARITSNFPISIVTHGLALNVTVQSYDGALDFGIVACRRALPDIGLFAACMRAAHDELLVLAQSLGAPGAARAPAKKRAPRKPRAPAPA
jgi:diacylglycerol O-acyltransferase